MCRYIFAAAFPKHAEVTLAVMSKLHAHTTIVLRGLACSRTVRKRSDFMTSAARYRGFAAPRLRHAYFRPIRATLCSSGDQCRLLCIAAIHARVAICNVAEHFLNAVVNVHFLCCTSAMLAKAPVLADGGALLGKQEQNQNLPGDHQRAPVKEYNE